MRIKSLATAGFTLPELIVTVAIAAILLGLAIPSYRTFMLDTRRSSVTNDVVAAMQAARSEAITRGLPVVVCPSSNGTSCTGGRDWRGGWIVFVDDNLNNTTDPTDDNGDRDIAQGELLLRVFPAQSDQVSITANETRFSFRPFAQTNTDGTVTICDERGSSQARGVITARDGRVRTSTTKSDGTPLSCS